MDVLVKLSNAMDRYYDGVFGGYEEGYEHFHNAAGQATLIKAGAEDLGLRCDVVGLTDLPKGTEHHSSGEGYDWAFVEKRWVVDMWALSYLAHQHVVFDLKVPEDKEWVDRCLGPAPLWKVVDPGDKEMEIARTIWSHVSLPYTAVDAMLGELPER